MGRTSSFVVLRGDAGWVMTEEAPRSAMGLAEVGGDGPSIVAQVLHSDVCYVRGRAPGMREWRWVFGEPAARSYAEEFDPSGWVDTSDPDELEDSVEQRGRDAAIAAAAWARASGADPADLSAIQDVLTSGHVLAEEALFALLDGLGVDATAVGPPLAEAVPAAPVTPTRQVDQPPPCAVAIDHSSDFWRHLDSYFLESRFGEPPSILRWNRNLYVLTDPPVCLGGGYEWIGDWKAVPTEYASTFEAAVEWAQSHVGRRGEPVTGTRPLLVLDDPPPSLPGWKVMPRSFLHERADHAKVAVRLEVEDSLDGEAAADLAATFYDRIIATSEATLGAKTTVTYGGEDSPVPHGLVVGGVTLRPDGRIGVTKATPTSWRQITSKLRTGDLVGAMCSITRTDANGRANMEPFSHMKAGFEIWSDADYEGQSGTRRRVVKVSVDLPYFESVFTTADAQAFAQAALTDLPVRRGYVHVGRWADSTPHWIDIVPAPEAITSEGYALAKRLGTLVWMQRGETPPVPLVEI